jgi:RNA polymerase sigma factor (sigma-70 family)
MALFPPISWPAYAGKRWRPLRLVLSAIAGQGQWIGRSTANLTPEQLAEHERIAAFERFFRQHESRISQYLWRVVEHEQTAYDLSQEAFLTAWEHFAEVSAHPSPASWLFRVATNLALGYLRRQKAPVGAAQPLDDELAIACADPTAQLGEREAVTQTLATLPPKQRALLILREIYGFSTEEAGRMLGLSHAATRRMLSRAHHRFRQTYLQKEGRL